jgi:hypothetical protein
MKTLFTLLNIIIFFNVYSNENESSSYSIEISSEYAEDLNPISIIKTIRGREPIAFTINNEKSKIVFIEHKEDGLNQELFFIVLAKINNTWIEFNSYSISEGFDIVRPINDSIQHIIIDNNTYMFFGTECYSTGTAYNGLTANTFVYYDDKRDSLLEVTYSIWAGEAMGNYGIKNSSLKNHISIIEHTTKQVEKMYGKQNLNIDDPVNYHLKWISMNNDIYENIEKYSNKWLEFNILKMPKDFFFSNVENSSNDMDVKSSLKYLAVAGFVNPVLAFSKEEQITFVLWIPAGWPSGAFWGDRSFKIDQINDDIIITSNEDYILYFDIKNSKVKATKK